MNLHFKGGGSFTELRPKFSFDEESVYVAWKNCILGYNTRTGKVIGEYKGLKNRIVGFSVQVFNSCECVIAVTTSGELAVWKTDTHFRILSKTVDQTKIRTFHIVPSNNENVNRAVISYEDNSGNIRFGLLDINKGTCRQYSLKIKSKGSYHVDVGNDNYFAVGLKRNVNFVRIGDFQNVYSHSLFEKRKITSICCHRESPIVLVGDSTGRVTVWQDLFTKNPSRSVFHWHTLSVNCVAFSTAGSYFYSGADECVVVRWQFDSLDKKFLPRLPSGIKQIGVSHNNQFLAIATADNAVRIVDSRFNEITLIQHLVIGDQYETGIALDPRTKALIMNGNVGHIQFYSPHDMNLLYNVDIVGQNKITNERDCKMENTRITKLAISKNGLWVATVEERKDPQYSNEIRLKFWKFNTVKQTFELNTSVEYPHEKSINAVQFQPSADEDHFKCVTVGDDSKFKVWHLIEKETVLNKSIVWECYGVGFYRNYPCKSLSFSIDGSLFAVGFGHILTTWLPDSCEIKCSLAYPGQKENINIVQFGKSNQCHLIVTCSASRLNVWNLLTLTMIWTVPVQVSLLVADDLTSYMAAVLKSRKLIIFTPDNLDPVYSNDKLLQEHEIEAASFIPNKFGGDLNAWSQRSKLYFIDSNKELYCLGDDISLPDKVEQENVKTSLYSMINPNVKTNAVKAAKGMHHLFEKDMAHKRIKKFLEAPLHTMVPIRLTCSSLLKSLVIQKDPTSL